MVSGPGAPAPSPPSPVSLPGAPALPSPWLKRAFDANRPELAAVAAGATAGTLSAFVCSPIDVLRTRFQVQGALMQSSGQYPRVSVALRRIWAEEGYRGFFRGYGTAAVIVPLFWGIYFPTYNVIKKYVGESACGSPIENAVRQGFAALAAAVLTDCATNPLWVVRTRMQTQALHMAPSDVVYMGTWHALRHITATEGVKSLWKGLTASLFGCVHAVVQFPLYEYLKRFTAEYQGVDVKDLSSFSLVQASVLSKLVASSIAYPHEVVRARLQDSRGLHDVGAVRTFRNILAHEGARGLYSGFSMNLIRTVPACAITFLTYERVFAAVLGPQDPITSAAVRDCDGVGGDFGTTNEQ